MSIAALIDKKDSFELVRDQVAAILATETASQQALATTALKDPDLWKFTVYTERKNPFSLLELDSDGNVTGDNSVVNVWLDNSNMYGGNDSDVQQFTAKIMIDCIAAKASEENGTTINASDYLASLDSERIARLVRNIIMSPVYSKIGLEAAKFVLKRNITGLQKMFADREDRQYTNVVVTRLTLEVNFNESVSQIEGVDLEQILIDVEKDETGLVLPQIQIDT